MTFSDLETCAVSVAEGIFDDICSCRCRQGFFISQFFFIKFGSFISQLGNFLDKQYSFHSPKTQRKSLVMPLLKAVILEWFNMDLGINQFE